MKIIHGQELVKELRKLSESVTRRIWIAVPYIGSPKSVRQILGKKWFEYPNVNVKLLTDTSDLSCINTETLQYFHKRGQVRTLSGLHAKIYIIDDSCLITSANLTNTAFSKRYEMGVILNKQETVEVIQTFQEWWGKSSNVKPEDLIKIYGISIDSKEESIILPTIFNLPADPGSFTKNLAKNFLNYDSLVSNYEDFAKKYSSIQRIWKNEPLYLEIDGLLNYLYHEAPKTPSKSYADDNPRKLSEEKQINEIRKWANNYKEWNENVFEPKNGTEDIQWRIDNSNTLKKFLTPNRVLKLTKEELEEAFRCLNSLNSYPINRTKILNNNSVSEIRNALNELVNGKGELAARMDFCNNIKNLGTSSMNEILGFTNPDKYPIMNKNTNSGLRFFGYQIRSYN